MSTRSRRFLQVFTVLLVGAAIAYPSAQGGRAADLVGASRFINTEEVNLKMSNGRYGTLGDVFAFAQKHGHTAPASLAGDTPALETALVVAADGKHYQFRVNGGDCDAAFSDDTGIIYLGAPIDCPTSGAQYEVLTIRV
jgi:hypothetical protein